MSQTDDNYDADRTNDNRKKKRVDNIDWDWQAKKFLELHGWYQEADNPFNDKAWFHKLFVMGEDETAYGGTTKMCEALYNEMWTAYKAQITGMVMLNEEDH